MKRIVVFGKSQRRTTRKVRSIVRAFREEGHETLWLNPAAIQRWRGRGADQHIIDSVAAFRPDLVFIHNQDIPLPVLHALRAWNVTLVMFYADWAPDILPSVAERAALVDHFLVVSSAQLAEYRAAGVRDPTHFLDACDRRDHRLRHPILPAWKSDVAFVGQARAGEQRISLVRALSRIAAVRVYGRDWEQFGVSSTRKVVGPRAYGLICGGAKIILGADIVSTAPGTWSNRLWITLGCGGFLLTNHVPGMEEHFTNHKHLVWYHSEEECLALAQEYLAKPAARLAIAAEGHRFVHANHTFHHFVRRVLDLDPHPRRRDEAVPAVVVAP